MLPGSGSDKQVYETQKVKEDKAINRERNGSEKYLYVELILY